MCMFKKPSSCWVRNKAAFGCLIISVVNLAVGQWANHRDCSWLGVAAFLAAIVLWNKQDVN